jgi:8-oxo-dGTP pyrophosphatase MutT (NUDIX family)
MKLAYGGVVFNEKGEVLLREAANHWGGDWWTFPKGRPEPGETPEAAAIRETREETGINAEIVQRLPGEYAGMLTRNIYFLMKPVGSPGEFDSSETQAIQWAMPEQARKLLALSENAAGRKRDLAVLEVAVAAWLASKEMV